MLEVIDAFEKANGIRIPYEFAPRRDGDVTEAWANPAYAKELLGWESKHDLESMFVMHGFIKQEPQAINEFYYEG